ncbi:MAG: thioesterase [Geodermatophilaceae bacterium]|jgi:predicted thioesterase|nr:thioesterase [Geodermatophilaceae bacterium]
MPLRFDRAPPYAADANGPRLATFTAVNGTGSTLIAVGRSARRVFEVVDLDTAAAMGSGSVPALGTPRLLAWMEAVTVAVLEPELHTDHTSVGTRVELEHVRPSAVGAQVCVEAFVTAVDGRRVDFDILATDADGTPVGRGRISRVVVERASFPDRLGPRGPG